ncbi:MAG: fibronectin type III domain-containing protein [Bacteroidetes bacterium]|nr:fibronectin type III domain-containing protein [Bacteroidota bacterium]
MQEQHKPFVSGSGAVIGSAAISGNTYSWSPSAGLSSATEASPTASPLSTTTYTLTETITALGCTATNSVTVNVNTLPAANAGTTQTVCSGSGAVIGSAAVLGNTYSWSPSAGLSSATEASPTASPFATTTYTLTETISATGCTATNSVTVNVNALPAANAGTTQTVCPGSGAVIGSAAVLGNTYSWSPSAGLSSATEASPTASPLATTTYTLTETISATGCTATNSVTVNVNALPAANAGATQTVCLGSGAVIGSAAILGNTYSWSPSAGLSSATDASPTASPLSTTTYTLTETITATGCTATNSVTVNVSALPAAITGANQSICNVNGVQLGASAVIGNTYSWSPTVGLNSATISNPTASPTTATTYTLTETVSATGCISSNTVTVSVASSPTTQGTINIQGNTALATWISVGPGYSYYFEKRKVGSLTFDAPWITSNTVWQMTSLLPSTQYEWHVRTMCSPGQFSEWSAMETFTTNGPTCGSAPVGLSVNNITSSSAELQWSPLSPLPDNYQLRYRKTGTTVWTNKVGLGTKTKRVITGLLASSTYVWQIRSRCGTAAPFDYSFWSATSTFTTLSGARLASEISEFDINVFPNPTDGKISITVDCDDCSYQVSLYDAIGKIVYSQAIKSELNEIQCDFGNIEKGIYFLEVGSSNGKKTVRLAIQ